MDNAQTDLEAIRRILAELTARVYRIERRLQMEVTPIAPVAQEAPVSPTTTPVTVASTRVVPPALPVRPIAPPSHPSQDSEIDLESRIGSHWLNRIGIAALLVGISYFLKFAFDNNWIGPAGRVTIGILAGIGFVVWSERFRSKGYKAFSYSLKAVGIGALYFPYMRLSRFTT